MLIKKEQFILKCANFVDLAHDHQLAQKAQRNHMGGIEQHDEQDGLSNEVYLSTTKKESTNA